MREHPSTLPGVDVASPPEGTLQLPRWQRVGSHKQ